MKTVMEEKLNEIEIPENLHERCIEGVRKAKEELKEERKSVERTVEGNEEVEEKGKL